MSVTGPVAVPRTVSVPVVLIVAATPGMFVNTGTATAGRQPTRMTPTPAPFGIES